MTVEGVQTPAGPGFAFVEPSRQGATPKLSTTVSRGQAFGMDYDFLSPREARGKWTNDFVSGAIDMLVAAATLLVNALMLAIALYSVISAGPLAVSQAFGTFGVPSEVAAPSAYNFAVDCQGSRRLPCGR
jgi:hypothetical protein